MISHPTFWSKEIDSLLMSKNAQFINAENAKALIDRAKCFKDLIENKYGLLSSNDKLEECDDEEMLRIFRLDAERTFTSEHFRENLIYTLKSVWVEIKDYHQGLGFVCSFLLLFLEPSEVIPIILTLNKKYIPGYFKSKAYNYFRDAKVFGKILKKLNPEASELIGPFIAPETYCSKWFIGLNVHVLPFEALISFFEGFFQKGDVFLFCYGLSLIENCQDLLSSNKDVSKILAILRLDSEIVPLNKQSQNNKSNGSFFCKVVEDAFTLSLEDIDIDDLRLETEAEMDAEEERRKKREAEYPVEEIIFSDEE